MPLKHILHNNNKGWSKLFYLFTLEGPSFKIYLLIGCPLEIEGWVAGGLGLCAHNQRRLSESRRSSYVAFHNVMKKLKHYQDKN